MKPIPIVLVAAFCALAGGAPSAAQELGPWSPIGQPGAVDEIGALPSPYAPGACDTRSDIADAFLWADYRGAYIEHDLYRPRYLAPPAGGARCSRPVLSGVGAWLDSLTAWIPFHRSHTCFACDSSAATDGAGDMPFAFDSNLESEYLGGESQRSGDTPLAPVPPPEGEPRLTPARPRVVAPTPIEPTPFQSRQIEPSSPPPAAAKPPAAQPVPAQPVAPAPRATTDRPPTNAIPPRLIPPRTPVVELAPEQVLPLDPDDAPPAEKALPRNRVPHPGEQLPRNSVPATR